MSAIGKTALSILLVLTIVGAALWLLGGKQSEYSTALSIDAPPHAIFPFLTQPDRLKNWTTGLSEVSEFMATPKVDGIVRGRPKKTPRVMTLADGSQVRYEDQVIRYEENLAISVQSSNAQQVMTSIYHLEPRDGQTFVSYRIKTNSCGIGRILAPLSSNDFQERIDGDIRKLKTLVESSSYPAAPEAESGNLNGLDSFGFPTNDEGTKSNPADNSIPDVSMSAGSASKPISASGNKQFQATPPENATTNTPPVSDAPSETPAGPNAETPVSGQPFSF